MVSWYMGSWYMDILVISNNTGFATFSHSMRNSWENSSISYVMKLIIGLEYDGR